MYGYIYKTTNLINGKIYIGQHKSKTFDSSYYGSGIILNKAFDLYGKENFKCEVLEWCKSKKDLNNREIYYINYYDSQDSAKGYNIAFGGSGGDTLTYLSEEDKQLRGRKISTKLKGRQKSEETLKRMSEGINKYYSNPDNRDKRSKINKQRYLDDPTLKERISKSLKTTYSFEDNKKKLSLKQKRLWLDPEYREKQHTTRSSQEYKYKMGPRPSIQGTIWINKDKVIKRIHKEELNTYLSLGWTKGRPKVSEETKSKMSKARKGRSMKGCKHTSKYLISCIEDNTYFNGFTEVSKKLNIPWQEVKYKILNGIKISGKTYCIIDDKKAGDDL